MADINIVTYGDVQRCPKKSLAAEHYRADGSCRCDVAAAHRARANALRVELAETTTKIREEIADLERGL